MKFFLQLFFTLTLLFTYQSFSQTGKITGNILDATTGEALPFVNVIIEGTNYGAATDLEGTYTMIGISPGNYSIRASAIGYNSVTVTDVKVSIDLTTSIDFQLSETSVELGEEVVIVATRPLITKDLTSSTSIVGSDEISALPVTEFQEVLELQAGLVGGSVRGGRRGEVVYAIDGVPVTDVYDGSTVVDVNANSIQELQFVSGAFNAEYGKALSGYVNIATKDGNNNFEGNFTSYIGEYFSSNTNIFRNIDDIDPLNIYNLEGSLSGPIIPNSLFFYVNARYIHFGGWMQGQRVFNPWDITVNNGPTVPVEERYDIDSSGDGSYVSMNGNRKIYGQGKLTFKPFSEVKVNLNYIIDDVEYRDYDHSFSFNPDGDFRRFRTGITNIVGITHTLSPTTFYQANFSYFYKKYQQYVYEDPFDPDYTHDLLLSQEPTESPSFRTGGTQDSRFKRLTSSYGGKIDITSQISSENLVKLGFEINRHQLTFNDVDMIQPQGILDPSFTNNPYVLLIYPDPADPTENLNIDIYERTPIEVSGYLQDKLELNEIIINAGLRFDYFYPDGQILTDPTDPDIYRPRRPANIYVGDTNNNGHLDEGDTRKTVAQRMGARVMPDGSTQPWYKNAEAKLQVSPRLGVAFPITDRGVIHFSYGHFFQIPNFDLLYTNPEYKFGDGTQNLGVAGNPDLRPQQTISGEVGVQQALTDELTFDLTGYFRDIRDLAGTRADEIRLFGGSGTYSQFVNSDFGFVKGIVFTVDKRLSNNWAATIDYTLQSAQGNASDPDATRNQIAGGEQPEVQLVPLNWDQAHTVNVTFTYADNINSWGFSLIGQYGSGFPYTPSFSANISNLLINSELKPSFFNMDLRAYKDFIFGEFRLSIFARVFNLFDTLNELNVYNDSGTADFTINEFLRRNDGNPNRIVNSIDEYYRNPTFYSEPRRIEFGATVFF